MMRELRTAIFDNTFRDYCDLSISQAVVDWKVSGRLSSGILESRPGPYLRLWTTAICP